MNKARMAILTHTSSCVEILVEGLIAGPLTIPILNMNFLNWSSAVLVSAHLLNMMPLPFMMRNVAGERIGLILNRNEFSH